MPSPALLWMCAICGSFIMACLVFGIIFVLCAGMNNQLGLIIPSIGAILVLFYTPKKFYEWAQDMYAKQKELLEAARRKGRISEFEEDEEDEAEAEFPLEGHDGTDIRKNF